MGICKDIEKVERYGYLNEPEEIGTCTECKSIITAGEKAYRIGNRLYCCDCVEEIEEDEYE